MRTNVIRYVMVATMTAMALVVALVPAFADAAYPPDEPSESVTTMEEPTGEDETAAGESDLARTGTGVVVPLVIGLTAVTAGAALLVGRRRSGSAG